MPQPNQDSGVTLKRRTAAFENTRFQVFADHIVDRTGNEVEQYLVVTPRSQRSNLLTGVAVIPVMEGRILFLNVYRHALGSRVLEVVRGFLDENEEPSQAALRELGEETGLSCPPTALLPLGVIQPEPGVLSARVALFAAVDCRPSSQPLDDELGIEERLWTPIPEVQRMLREFEVEESSTCVALHRYFELADRKNP